MCIVVHTFFSAAVASAVKVGGKGDITPQRLWQHPQNIQRVGTGVLHDGHVYIMEENGVPHCYDVKTGEELWRFYTVPKEGDPGSETWKDDHNA